MTYHHSSVLQAFLSALETILSSYSVSESLQHHMNFVRPGTKIKKSMKKPHTALLHLAPEWRVMSDFNTKLVISILDSNLPTKIRYIYFFKGAKDLHNYRTDMSLQGKHGGLAPEKI